MFVSINGFFTLAVTVPAMSSLLAEGWCGLLACRQAVDNFNCVTTGMLYY